MRACSRSSVSTSPTASATLRIVAGSVRSRRIATSGSSRWCCTIAHERVDVVRRRARAAGRSSRTSSMPAVGVVAGVALAEVVEQGAEHEQVGPVDPVGERGGVGRRLPQVPVDGEAVVGVALRAAAHRRPLRAAGARGCRAGRAPRARRSPGGPGAAGRRARRAAPSGQRVAPRRRRRPRRRSGRASSGPARRRAGRRRGRPAARAPGRRRGRRGPVSSTSRSTTTSPSPTRSSWPSWWRDDVAPRPVGDPGDAAGGGGDVGHQHVGRRRAEPGGDGVLVLEPQHVAGPPLLPVQGDADVDERAVAAVEHGEVVGRHDEVGVGRPPQRVHVAQPAVAVLEVGLEQVGDVAGLAPALDDLGAQGVEPAPAVAPPPRERPRVTSRGAELVVAGQRPGAEQRRRRVEVVGGQRQLVVERAHGVAELEAGVPQRVPQLLGQLVDARPACRRRAAGRRRRCAAPAPGGRTRRRRRGPRRPCGAG